MSGAARPCMGVFRPLATCALLAGLGWPGPSPALAQANTRPMIDESVTGTLEAVDKGLGGIIVRSESGDRLAWRLSRAAVEEAGRYKLGAPVRVHYRQRSPGNRAVTAVSFPGEGAEAVYVNATGDRIVLRTGDATADGTVRVRSRLGSGQGGDAGAGRRGGGDDSLLLLCLRRPDVRAGQPCRTRQPNRALRLLPLSHPAFTQL